jgi:arginyl-tRNA synthetase
MKERIEQALKEAVARLCEESGVSLPADASFSLERPKDDQFGEYTTNIALILAKHVGKSPMEIAEIMKERLVSSCRCNPPAGGEAITEIATPKTPRDDECLFGKIAVMKPGHINFFLKQSVLTEALAEANERKEHFGDATNGAGKKVNNEFVSANPTGPLHLGNARGGFFGDALSRVLRKTGFEVTNEYYVNDAGEQLLKLGHSVLKDTEAAYTGEYIDELHSKFQIQNSKISPKEIGEWAAAKVLTEYIQPTLKDRMGIVYDRFISEKKDIIEAGYVDKALVALKEKGLTYENEGALWLRTTDFGDDKDRVLVKGDGTRTYFASDCGYLLHKMERDYDTLLETWGADHHGYVARLTAAARALGFAGELRFTLVQLVRLVKDGVEVKMSKRAGNVVTVDELIDLVGPDVARFFFLLYSPDTHMNFDLGLAEERSQKNPVFYVQYAHARLASVLRKAEEMGITGANADLTLLTHGKERALLRELLFFRDELLPEIAATFAVHKLPQFAIRLADRLHSFYDECRVIDPENRELSAARLVLVAGVKTVLGETLRLMGVSAPERMEQNPSLAKASDGQGGEKREE